MADMNEILKQAAQMERDAQYENYSKAWHEENGAVTNKEEDNAGKWYDNTPEKKRKHREAVEKIRQDLMDAEPAPTQKNYDPIADAINEIDCGDY